MQYSLDERGKVFVGGLSWDTTHASMLKYFSHYGEVIDCVVMKNQATGRSRGFGFVTFKDPECVNAVLSLVPHILDGRQIDPKSCNPRSMNKGGKSAENSRKKIFIGGLPLSATEPELRDQFSAYGEVAEVVIMYDQQKHRSRGFAFLTFESEESVDRVIEDHFTQVNGKQVEVKRAEPRDMKTIADMSPICVARSIALQQQQQQQQLQRIGQQSAAVGPVVALANPCIPAATGAAGSFPISYSALPAPYCHNAAATLVAQCFQHPGVSYTIGVGDQCGNLPLISAASLAPLYAAPWLQLSDFPMAPLDLNNAMNVSRSGPGMHPALPPAPSCHPMMNSDLLGRFYTMGLNGGAPYGVMEGNGGETMDGNNKTQSVVPAVTNYHQLALNDYGLGLCSMMAQNGSGDSVGFSFIDPTNGAHTRIAAYHSIAMQGFHPYKR